MKRTFQFSIIVIALLILAYSQPVVFPDNTKKTTQKEEKTDVDSSHTSFPYGELEAGGLAIYVGKETEEFTKVFGEPIEIQKTALDYDWLIFGEDERDYIQVAVKNGKITSIFSLGHEIETTPFKIGMTLTDISALTQIYSNFDFEKKELTYKIELTEEDMNYRPLVAFDNGSFAILHLSQGTGKLIAVRYLDKTTLLRLMPYQLNLGQLEENVVDEQNDWEAINNDRKRQLQSILTILRKRNKLSGYAFTKQLDDVTTNILIKYLADPKKVLLEDERVTEWRSYSEVYEFNHPFSLSQTEFRQLLTLGNLNAKDIHGIFYAPSYDVPFLTMTWYSDNLSHSQFSHKLDKEVGISFSKDAVLFLFSEKESSLSSDQVPAKESSSESSQSESDNP